MPTVEEFKAYIQHTKNKAADQDVMILELSAEDIHVCVAGPSRGGSDMAACREAMQAELQTGDEIVAARNGKTKNLTILYRV